MRLEKLATLTSLCLIPADKSMSDKICKNYFVTGKVQGVWFRAHTQREAEKLGLTGWVRNLPDGSVEVLACGDENALAQLEIWLRRGPERALVAEVTSAVVEYQTHSTFEII